MGGNHFIAADLAAVRHNYELKPRPEAVLSLDAKQSGLGDSSCGPSAGTLRGFASANASFAPVFSSVSGARRIGQVMIANLRKKFCQSLARRLTEKFYRLSSNAVVSKLSNLKLNSLNSLWTYIIPS
jgi:hypothetical protein